MRLTLAPGRPARWRHHGGSDQGQVPQTSGWLAPHIWPDGQVPQWSVSQQPSLTSPQSAPSSAQVRGAQARDPRPERVPIRPRLDAEAEGSDPYDAPHRTRTRVLSSVARRVTARRRAPWPLRSCP